MDNITGTSGNDTISAVFDEKAAQSTLQLADLVDGGAGRDTLSIRYTDSDAGTATIKAATAPVFKNIEVLELNPLVDLTANLTGIAPNLDTINIVNPVGKATITAAPTAVKTVGLSGVNSDGADVSITFAAGLTGKNDAVTLNVSGASAASKTTANAYAQVDFAGAAAGDGVDIINVNSAGSSANRLDRLTSVDSASPAVSTLTTVNIEGAAAFRVNTALANTVKTIDASKSTGGVNLGVAAGDNVTFTGGTGNDRIDMVAGLTADDKLVGGDGTDTLAISDAAITADKTQAINKAIEAQTGFEKLELTAGAPTDSSSITLAANGLTAIKEFVFTGGGTAALASSAAASAAGNDAIQLTGFASANTNKIEIGATFTGGAGVANGSGTSIGGAGGDALQVGLAANSPADETTITLKGFTLTGGAGGNGGTGTGGADGGVGGYGINAADFETINLVSAGSTATATNTLAGGAGGAPGTSANAAGAAGTGILVNTNSVINVTGANDLTFTTQTVNPTAGGVQVKAASFTGKLVVTGTTGNDLITGGANDDTITGGAGRDTIDLSAGGKDTVVLGVTAADRDTIKGFTAGADSDKLDIYLSVGTSVLKTITGTGTAFTIAATDAVTAFNFAATNNSANLAGATDGTELLKGVANQGSTIGSFTATASDIGYIVAYDGTNSYLYHFLNDTDTSLAASEIALIGVLENVATGTLVAGNFA